MYSGRELRIPASAGKQLENCRDLPLGALLPLVHSPLVSLSHSLSTPNPAHLSLHTSQAARGEVREKSQEKTGAGTTFGLPSVRLSVSLDPCQTQSTYISAPASEPSRQGLNPTNFLVILFFRYRGLSILFQLAAKWHFSYCPTSSLDNTQTATQS